VDTRDTPEQAELRRAARQLARELAAGSVGDLDDTVRSGRLAAAVRAAGWLELRDDGGGGPLAGGEEAAIIADALAGTVADVAFTGPVLAADLARRAGGVDRAGAVVAFSSGLIEPAVVTGGVTTTPLFAVDPDPTGTDPAFVLVADGDGFSLARIPSAGDPAATPGTDLTRAVRTIPAGAPVTEVGGQSRRLTADDLAQWSTLGLALTTADLVGVMRGVLDVTVAYAAERRQYGVPVGSFQAVQHLLAEAHCLMEGSLSVALHASWAVDNLPPEDALDAGRVAKAYATRAARTVCETAVQVHGGIGNTWECIAHVYLRRALLSSQWFGDDGVQLRELQRTRLGATTGVASGLS
jgi:hypothetical protein